MFDGEFFGAAVLIIVIAVAASLFRVLREYERGVIFMLGRFYKVKGLGAGECCYLLQSGGS